MLLEAIRRTIGADRIVIVGQSWGGSLAAQYVAAHPDRVAKVSSPRPGRCGPAPSLTATSRGVSPPRSNDATTS
ncbi:alpha/beta fold hydrolase [Nonomuraea sp. NPDC003201]